MKTAVSVPQELFEDGERLARKLQKSRSQLYSEALAEYVARRDPDRITAAMDAVCEDVDSSGDALLTAAARKVLERSEW